MGQFLWLLDNGNGGVMDGIYRTPGKRSPKWADGSQLFEGEFNRAIVNRVVELCIPEGIRYQVIAPELEDISLGERVRRANAYHAQDSCIFVSIHSNAGGGTGYEVFTSKGETKSDQVAAVFFDHFQAQFPHKAMRSDVSDVDKEANFYVLRKTLMPAILTENFFMGNEEECKRILMTRDGRDKIAMAHFTAMQAIEANGL